MNSGGGVNEIRSGLTNKAETLPFIDISALDINSFAVELHNYILNNCETGKNYNIYGAWAGHTYFNGFAYRVTNSFITILVNIAPDILEIYTNGNSVAVNVLTGVNYSLVDSVKGDTITRLRGNVTKISNVVTITGAWTGSATNEDVITLLPEAYRPSGAVAVIGSGTIDIGGTLAYAEYSVLPDGRIRQAQVVGAVSGGTFTFCYTI